MSKRSPLPLLLITLLTAPAFAKDGRVVFLPNGERCEISDDMPIGGDSYDKSDRKDVDKLCRYDPYINVVDQTDDRQAVGVCPKLNSTFPAVEFIEIDKGSNRAAAEARCNRKVGGKTSGKVAKYKYTTSGANTASILGYYHISRVLGINSVPPAVQRTMDVQAHIAVAERATRLVRGNSELISRNWRSLLNKLRAGDSAIMTPDGKMSFGALSKNPRGEQKTYDGIYLGGSGQGARLSNFMSSGKSTYRQLKKRRPVTDFIGTELTDQNYTALRQMKDVADMIVLDTIFGQRDRFGNTHSIYTWMILDDDGKLKKRSLKDIEKMMKKDVEAGIPRASSQLAALKRADDMKKDWRKQITPRLAKIRRVVASYLAGKNLQFAFAENLMLKDNDAGLKTGNPFVQRNVIGSVYHINPTTYAQLEKLYQAVIVERSMDDFLRQNLAMNPVEMQRFKTGLTHVATDLMDKKARGSLFQDLAVKSHFKVTPRETTEDGLPIYSVSRNRVNVRTAAVLTQGTIASSLYRLSGVGQKTRIGDKVAVVMVHPPVGRNTFIEVRVVESNHLPIGETVFLWQESLR